jgi:predicted ATPase
MQVAEERRLEANSPSYVLCDRETFEGITIGLGDFSIDGDQITFKRVSGVKLKGRRRLVSAYTPHLRSKNLLSATGTLKKGPNLIGRLKELEIFTNHLRALTRSETFLKVIVIEGEEGIGKSALLKEYLVDDAPRNVQVYEGRGDEFHQAESYHAWKPVFKEIFGIDSREDDLGSQRRKVMRKLPILPGEKGFPALALRLSPLLNPVLDLKFAENRVTKAMAPEVREQTTRLFLLRLLQQSFYDPRRRRQQPHMIILDNGQWLDDDSWRLAATVKNLVRPLMMVIAARPLHQDGLGWPPHPACSELLSERNLERISLSHLSRLQMADIYSEIAAPCNISQELADVLWNVAGGNPSLARQLIDHWRAEELICTDSNMSANVGGEGAIKLSTIPGPVQKNLVGRIDRLQPERQLIVKAASFFDGRFTEMELDQLLKRIGVDLVLSDHLPILVNLQLVTIAEEIQPRSYQLSNELLRDVTRNLLTKAQRARFQDADLMAS